MRPGTGSGFEHLLVIYQDEIARLARAADDLGHALPDLDWHPQKMPVDVADAHELSLIHI